MSNGKKADSQTVYFRSADFPSGGFLFKNRVRIAPNDRGFMFADGLYEVVRSYGGRFFGFAEHLARLRHSLAEVGIDFPEIGELPGIAQELVRRNGLETTAAVAYIQLTRGLCERRYPFPTPPVVPTLYIEVNRLLSAAVEAEQGIAAITVPDIRWSRCDIKWLGLLPNVLARQRAVAQGANEAIFVRDGVVTEGTHTNVFGVKAGVVLTHPSDHHILAGITRAQVIQLCRALRLPVEERPILQAELAGLDELFLTSTTGEITPVVVLDSKPVGRGRPGPLTQQLQRAFRDLISSLSQGD